MVLSIKRNNCKRVSVIIPCYNHGQYVADAINSVLGQTYDNIEIVCINDASSDNSDEVLEQLSQKHDNLIYIKNDTNEGISCIRNKGISVCSGEYILPLDADDKIAPTYIEKAVNIIEKDTTIGMVYCRAEYFGAKTGEWILEDFNPDRFLLANCIFSSALFRKSDWLRAGKYKENMNLAFEDYDFWLSLIELNLKPYKIPEVLFYYRKHKTPSLANNCTKFRDELWKNIIRNHKELYLNNDKILERIYAPERTETGKKHKKYKKYFNQLLIIVILETIIILSLILYIGVK